MPASINKTSLREQLSQLTKQFERLQAEGKISDEISVLINGMLTLLNVLCAIFLEKNTPKTSANSGKPSSQTNKDETTTQHGSKGKGKAERLEAVNNHRESETVTIKRLDQCSGCGEDLRTVPHEKYERRTKIDIIFEKVIHHVDAEIKCCPQCKTTQKAVFPSDMHGPLQYGDGLKAYAINLIVGQMVSLNRVQKGIKSLIGQVISEASLLKFVLRLHEALASWELKAIEVLQQQLSLHTDETSLRVDQKRQWIHVYASGDITLKLLHPKRGKEAIETFNIIPNYDGVIIHDCWASYLSYDHCDHGLCGSHLLRELAFIIEANDYRWAKNMKRLLQETCRKVTQCDKKMLSESEYRHVQKRYRSILTRGEKELPEIPRPLNQRRGQVAKSDAHNLWERFKRYEKSVLLFAKVEHVAFTNNRAERDLRMSKVKQKVSGCFRQQRYAEAYCRISSYLQTMSNKGYNPLIAIQMALMGSDLWGE